MFLWGLLCVLSIAAGDLSSSVSFTSGRHVWTPDGAARFDWSGVQFSFSVRCPNAGALSLSFDIASSQAANDIGSHEFRIATLTGGDAVRFVTSNIKANVRTTFNVGIQLRAANDTVIVTKETEALFGIVTLYSVATNCIISKPSSTNNEDALRVEFVGDSITCGFGVLGKAPCNFTSASESFSAAWAGLVGEALSLTSRVRFHAESWSGKGVVRNYGGAAGPTMPELFKNAIANDASVAWNFSSFQPEILVILLGCNDFSTEPRPSFPKFKDGYNAFLDFIEQVYPNLKRIIVTCGPFSDCCYGNFQKLIVDIRADRKVSFFSFDGTVGSNLGCVGHPDTVGAKAMAKVFLDYLAGNEN